MRTQPPTHQTLGSCSLDPFTYEALASAQCQLPVSTACGLQSQMFFVFMCSQVLAPIWLKLFKHMARAVRENDIMLFLLVLSVKANSGEFFEFSSTILWSKKDGSRKWTARAEGLCSFNGLMRCVCTCQVHLPAV